ncbi:MAG: sigma-70 family RNA polymerase sigma factor [Lentisphaeria bacterium]|nr:sigma-70 family RNA polymerase sigma factor [Lentisphaeria bacterium]
MRQGCVFPHTRWSLVVSAADGAEVSLETLCRLYWQPVYAVARHAGHDVETAKDLTQGFFAKLLEKGWLGSADRERGRFRTFLVTALKRYMINEWRRECAVKRGGRAPVLPLDTALAERIEAREGAHALSPDALFDRRWALALLDQAMRRLEAEWPGGQFDILKPCLTAGRGEIDYAALARQLACSEGAARVAAHRLRKRYRAVIREEVARTVADDTDVADELRALMNALG